MIGKVFHSYGSAASSDLGPCQGDFSGNSKRVLEVEELRDILESEV